MPRHTLSGIPDHALLGIGDANWNYHLSISGSSRSVRSVPKQGPQYAGCRESGFGSLLYWRGYLTRKPQSVHLTPEGQLIAAARREEIIAIGGA